MLIISSLKYLINIIMQRDELVIFF